MDRRFLALAMAISLIGGACGPGGRSRQGLVDNFPREPLTLEIWRPIDDATAFERAQLSYRGRHPNVTFEYRLIDPDRYEEEVINALASGAGPDIISLKNDQLPRFIDKLVPMPDNFFRGSKPVTAMTADFSPALKVDAIHDGKVFGYPLYSDSLALFWNVSLFREMRRELARSGVEFDETLLQGPPADWNSVVELAKLLTKRNGQTIERSAIALGPSSNVPHLHDLAAALLLQQGAEMTTKDRKAAAFHLPSDKDRTFFPGLAVLNFLKQFTDPKSPAYTWNADQIDAVEAFFAGKTAMMINYQSVIPIIEQRNPDLKFATAPLPQLAKAKTIVDFASYHLEAVTSQSKFPQVAWDYLQHLDQFGLASYQDATGRTKAKRSGQATTTVDERFGRRDPFKLQIPTAQSWFKGNNALAVDASLRQMVDRVLTQGQDPQASLNQAAGEITQLLSGP